MIIEIIGINALDNHSYHNLFLQAIFEYLYQLS